jgi:hypothetical protein
MSKPCDCSIEKRVNGTHYTWCGSLQKEEEPKSEEATLLHKCDCNPERRNGNHYHWCESLKK